MQLIAQRRGIRRTLATLAAGLLASSEASAADATPHYPASIAKSDLFYQTQTDTQDTGSSIDVGVLYYQEADGRVRAIEPTISGTLNVGPGLLSLGLISDSLTGASPNGATPSSRPQNFVTPILLKGSTTTATTASGGSTIIQLPPTPGQVAAATLGRQYTTPPDTLPVDAGFHDQRFAGNIGWSQSIDNLTRYSVGGAYSSESDYRAATITGSLSRDFNEKNTTLSVASSLEFDASQPFGGTPTPLTSMNAQWKGPDASRKVFDVNTNLTQVMNRWWLLQVTYSFGLSNGYNNDPYRIISVVDGVSGFPTDYLYENRPRNRDRQSIYTDNKFSLGANTLEISGRYFWDSWSIHSVTAEINDRFDVTGYFYVEPRFRWYHQTAASFYRPYLVAGNSLPAFASSDTRIGNFSAITPGLKLGLALTDSTEVNILGQYYKQSGNGHPADAIGQLKQENLFAGVKATSVLFGYSLRF